MGWVRRDDTREGDKAHGISFVMWERRDEAQLRGEAAVTGEKIHLDATVSLTLALGQYKYRNELVAQAYSIGPHKVEKRQADRFKRIQVYLGPANERTADVLEEIAAEIRERLKEGRRGQCSE
jgi:hypothetical protein